MPKSNQTGFEPTDEEELSDQMIEEGADTTPVEPAEVAALHSDTETVKEIEKAQAAGVQKKTRPVRKTAQSAKKRSGRYLEVKKQISDKRYSLEEGIELAKKTAATKFDPTIEIHVRLEKAKGKAESGVRGTLTLPAGGVKPRKVVILDEPMVEKITKGFLDFDVVLATPALMPKVAKLAKILGPKGKMPTPKTGTVVDDPERAKKEFESGKIEYRTDAQNIVHLAIGKASWPTEKIVANAQALLSVLPLNRIKSVSVNATMGPGVGIALL